MNHRKKLDSLLSRYQHFKQQVQDEKEALSAARKRVEDTEQAQSIVQTVAQSVQTAAHERIAGVVSRCLETVFGKENAYEFRIVFDRKRGRTEARLVFLRGANEIDPTTASGGGAVDLAALALRLSCLVLNKPPLRRLLVMDEPLKNLNGEQYQERVGSLLLELSREMGIQMVLVSDDDWLQVGKVVRIH